ncbi:MAG: 50S ribosomal protein L5 [Nitrospirae bacterium]|nr:50S ribosomal protein L5 [Candidatus Troglogloeales bacterium]MBI3598658.1 50S ribosomal protein L5 [Candidatus Troglogloeales bacterium]
MAPLRERYVSAVVPELIKEFRYKNAMQVPKLEKVILNVGMGKATSNAKMLEAAVAEVTGITGQKPIVTRAKKSIAGFKLREGVPIGCKVTLRKSRMYEFLERLLHAALPRIRDFRGISPTAFDGKGNYTLGLKEQLIFPEIHYEGVTAIHGMDITVVTTAKNDVEGKALLKHLGFPFKKEAPAVSYVGTEKTKV